MRGRAKNGLGTAASRLITGIDPKSPAAEAYRTLRTNIQFAGLDGARRTIVVTSASQGEGKTTTVANFGVVAAQAGNRVCLVDSDLRRPTLHRVFNIQNTRGLTTALVEGSALAEVALPTRVPNLSLVTSGPVPPNPVELLGSRRMRDFLDGGSSEFDLVLCDTPPVIPVADGLALSAQCDGVILVVLAGTVPHKVIRKAVEQIEAVNGRILGVLLNKLDFSRAYSDYYRYYQAYYGEKGKIETTGKPK